jgi:hypothetical protein
MSGGMASDIRAWLMIQQGTAPGSIQHSFSCISAIPCCVWACSLTDTADSSCIACKCLENFGCGIPFGCQPRCPGNQILVETREATFEVSAPCRECNQLISSFYAVKVRSNTSPVPCLSPGHRKNGIFARQCNWLRANTRGQFRSASQFNTCSGILDFCEISRQ